MNRNPSRENEPEATIEPKIDKPDRSITAPGVDKAPTRSQPEPSTGTKVDRGFKPA